MSLSLFPEVLSELMYSLSFEQAEGVGKSLGGCVSVMQMF